MVSLTAQVQKEERQLPHPLSFTIYLLLLGLPEKGQLLGPGVVWGVTYDIADRL